MKRNNLLKPYLNELKKTKYKVTTLLLTTILSYSIYLFCSDNTIIYLDKENTFFEAGTALLFLVCSVISILSFTKTKNKWHLLLGIVFFLGFGEEISWGQQLFKFNTPKIVKEVNVQKEFNLHNIEIFNSENFNHTYKKGWRRLTEINFLFKLFCITYGICIPFLKIQSQLLSNFFKKIKLPVPEISVGFFFFFCWIYYQLILSLLPKGKPIEYYETSSEIFEFLTSVIFFIICSTFLNEIIQKNKKTPRRKVI